MSWTAWRSRLPGWTIICDGCAVVFCCSMDSEMAVGAASVLDCAGSAAADDEVDGDPGAGSAVADGGAAAPSRIWLADASAALIRPGAIPWSPWPPAVL